MLYWIVKGTLTPLLRAGYRIHVEGKEHVPRDGAAILAATTVRSSTRSSSRSSSAAASRSSPRPSTSTIKKTAWFFRGVGQIPIRREGGSASERALDSAAEVLQAGGVFGIYPEGTRTRDGYMHRGHTGVARLAMRPGAPIIPVGLIGTDEVQPIDKKMPRLFRRGRDPLRRTARTRLATAAAPRTTSHSREYTDEIMYEIGQLSGLRVRRHLRDAHARSRNGPRCAHRDLRGSHRPLVGLTLGLACCSVSPMLQSRSRSASTTARLARSRPNSQRSGRLRKPVTRNRRPGWRPVSATSRCSRRASYTLRFGRRVKNPHENNRSRCDVRTTKS